MSLNAHDHFAGAAGLDTGAVREVLADPKAYADEVRADADPATGKVAFGFLHTMGAETVPGLLHAFRADHPRIRFSLVQNYGEAMLERLRAGELDLCLTSPVPDAPDLVAEADGGELVGWAASGPYRDGEVRTADAELYALYLRPEHIGRGVGRALLTEVTHRCASAGHRWMYLWVLKDNARARRFYEKYGFEPEGTYAFMVGTHADEDIVMRLKL